MMLAAYIILYIEQQKQSVSRLTLIRCIRDRRLTFFIKWDNLWLAPLTPHVVISAPHLHRNITDGPNMENYTLIPSSYVVLTRA